MWQFLFLYIEGDSCIEFSFINFKSIFLDHRQPAQNFARIPVDVKAIRVIYKI